MLALLSVPLLQSVRYLGESGGMVYGYAHVFVTYEHGFVKRGLYGEMMRAIPFIEFWRLGLIGFVSVAVATTLAYVALVRRPLLDPGGALVLAFLLAGCGVLPHLAFISGFLDVQLFAIVVANLLLLGLVRQRALQLATTVLLTGVGILVHEAYVLLFYPAVLLVQLSRDPDRPLGVGFWLAQAAIASMLVAVVLMGKLSVDPAVALTRAQARTDMPVEPDVFRMLASGLDGQRSYLAGQFKARDFVGQLVTLLVSLPYPAALWMVFRRTIAASRFAVFPSQLLALLPLAPLLLTAVGHDIMRWVSATCIDMALFAAFALGQGMEPARAREIAARLSGAPWFVACFLLTLICGPFGAVVGNRLVAKLAALAGL